MALWKDQYGREQTTPEAGAGENCGDGRPISTRLARRRQRPRPAPVPAKPRNRCSPPA